MAAGLPSAKRAIQVAPMRILQQQKRFKRRSAMTSRAMACSKTAQRRAAGHGKIYKGSIRGRLSSVMKILLKMHHLPAKFLELTRGHRGNRAVSCQNRFARNGAITR